MRISFHGAAGGVTGSNHLIETGGHRFLIDCGMFQGQKEMRTRNFLDFPYDPASIEAVLLTHAHIDHSGLLPKLVKGGFSGPIYATHATAELIEVLLHDSAHIQAGDASWENKKRKRRGMPKIEPIYTPADVDHTLSLVREIPYHQAFTVCPGVIATWRDAGHIMGSAYLKLEVSEDGITKKLIASGDLGRTHQAIISDPEVGSEADYLIIESTYGDRDHKNTDDTNAELVRILEQVVEDKGTLLIPAFAVGRTQEMIYRFFELSEKHSIPPVKIFVDSPMASRVTAIYEENRDLYDQKTLEYLRQGKNPLRVPGVQFTGSVKDSMAINEQPGPKVIISASGMCDAGRIVHHLKHHIWQKNCHLLFVGYQARGTLGRRLIEGAQQVSILGETLAVNAQIHTVGGLSAHADRTEMLAWLNFYKTLNPYLFIVHGDPEASEAFAGTIRERFGLECAIPGWHDTAVIDFTAAAGEERVRWERHQDGSARFAERRLRWQERLGRINEYLRACEAGEFPSDRTPLLEQFLERAGDALETLLEELRVDLKR